MSLIANLKKLPKGGKMAITVILDADWKISRQPVAEGEYIHFEHPGAPLQVRTKDGKTLFTAHPSKWICAYSTEKEDN